jgi:hypothetical protein
MRLYTVCIKIVGYEQMGSVNHVNEGIASSDIEQESIVK